MSKKPYLAQQGDVLLIEVPTIPDTAKPVKLAGEATLALGETSGHRHAIVGREIAMFRDDGTGGATYVRAEKPMSLDHLHGTTPTGEHASIPVPASVALLVEIQSQWTDADEPIRSAD